jgi:glycerol-3-phosphate O-acyltransferase / dihydroxyacetone phosphate acyltransferase
VEALQEFVHNYTYLGVFIVLLLGSLGVPIPEEMPIIAAAVLSHEGIVRWWLALPICLLGVLSGDVVLYWVGRHWGERVLDWRLVRLVLSPAREQWLKAAYRRHALKTVVTARHVMGLRAAAFLTAGSASVPFWKFVLADAGAALIGVPLAFGLAYFFTDQIKAIMADVHRAERWLGLAGLLALATMLGVGVWRWHRRVGEERGPAASQGSRDTPRVDPFYAVVRVIARFWIWFFFERVEIQYPERVPRVGPVLLCINHPNNLIDSLLVGSVLRRKVHYLASSALFRHPLVARFLVALEAIPVHRMADDPDKVDRSLAMFAACGEAFDRGRLIAIYPEGATHSEAHLRRIKTGAARIALGYEAHTPGRLTVVAVGLSFEARQRFRGRVLVSFGEPVDVSSYLSVYRTEPVKALHGLTTAIQSAMEREMVHVERIETAALARALETLYRGELERELWEGRGRSGRRIDPFQLSGSISGAVEHFRRLDPGSIERLWQRILGYRAGLAAYRLRDQAVSTRLERTGDRRQRVARSWQTIAGLPLFAYGAAVNFLPYYLPGWFAGRMSRRQTDYATTRLLASIVAFPLFWALETSLVGWVAGLRWALAFFLSLPVGGLIAYQYLVGTGRLRHQLRFGALLLTRAQEARRLVAERREIVEELERARRDYLAGREAITSSRSDTSSAGDGSMGDRTVFAIAVCLALLLATFVLGAGGLAHSILP